MDVDIHLSVKLGVIMLSWTELDDMGCQMLLLVEDVISFR